jgi:hypothetical protein
MLCARRSASNRARAWSPAARHARRDGLQARHELDLATGIPSGAGIHSAQAVIGLLAHPYGAAADAGRLAVDVHEAIQGACDALPLQLAASVGIVRGLAAGRRDDAGHLVQPRVQESGAQLAALLAERAPPGQTWSRAACTAWCDATSSGPTCRR